MKKFRVFLPGTLEKTKLSTLAGNKTNFEYILYPNGALILPTKDRVEIRADNSNGRYETDMATSGPLLQRTTTIQMTIKRAHHHQGDTHVSPRISRGRDVIL